MATRTSRRDQLALALDDLAHLGGGVRIETGPTDIVLVQGRVRPWSARVHAYDIVGERLAKELVGRTRARGPGFVVANQISEPARRLLEQKQWSWLDRRIGAHIADIERDIEVRWRSPRERPTPTVPDDSAIRGRAGVSYAAALLCTPDDPPSMRSVAAAVGMSPQSVSNAARLLVAAGLVDTDHRPLVPDLFWALARVWRPVEEAGLAEAPPREPAWVDGGDQAAATLGAPIVALHARPWFWVPSGVDVRRMVRRYGAGDAATVAVPPTPLVLSTARDHAPHPLFVALDLARDPGRGRQILEQWAPEGAAVVWR